MRYLLLFHHPILGRVYYGDRGTMTSDGRKVIMIKYNETFLQGFYQSSGMQSGYEGTWFPFDGDVTNSQTGEPILLKVSNTTFASQFKTFIKKTKDSEIRYQKNMIKFGTLTFLYISYQLGGGLWNNRRESIRVLANVPKIYREYEDEMKNHWNIRKVTFPSSPKSQQEVNLFLKDALSFNYLKGTEYPASFNGDWILNYKDIYNGERYLFYPNTKIAFKRSLLTKCHVGEDEDQYESDLLLDFMIEYDHNNTSLTNFFYPSIHGQSIFENRYCKKFGQK